MPFYLYWKQKEFINVAKKYKRQFSIKNFERKFTKNNLQRCCTVGVININNTHLRLSIIIICDKYFDFSDETCKIDNINYCVAVVDVVIVVVVGGGVFFYFPMWVFLFCFYYFVDLLDVVKYLDSFQVDGVHHCSLKKLHRRIMTFQQSFQFQIRLLSVIIHIMENLFCFWNIF